MSKLCRYFAPAFGNKRTEEQVSKVLLKIF